MVPSARAQRPIDSANEIILGCQTFLLISQGNTTVNELGQLRGGVCAGKMSAELKVADILEPKIRFCRPDARTEIWDVKNRQGILSRCAVASAILNCTPARR
jgi:hypothetical protein